MPTPDACRRSSPVRRACASGGAKRLLDQAPQSEPQSRALGILWDAADQELPIYRTDPADSDVENTLASAVFRVGADKVEWAVYDATHEAARFEMRDRLVPVAT